MAITAKEALEIETIEVVADKGYRKQEDILESIQNGIIPNVNVLDGEEHYNFIIDYNENQITEAIINSAEPENIKKCLEAGVLPTIYEGSKITVEIIEQEIEVKVNENFVRDRVSNTVTCPMGFIFKQKATVAGKIRYVNKAACYTCR